MYIEIKIHAEFLATTTDILHRMRPLLCQVKEQCNVCTGGLFQGNLTTPHFPKIEAKAFHVQTGAWPVTTWVIFQHSWKRVSCINYQGGKSNIGCQSISLVILWTKDVVFLNTDHSVNWSWASFDTGCLIFNLGNGEMGSRMLLFFKKKKIFFFEE